MCVFCFQTKKGQQIINLGPLTGRQPRKTSRGKSSRNCSDFNEPRCAGWEPQTVKGDRDSPRPNTSHPSESRRPGLRKHSPNVLQIWIARRGKHFESTGETSESAGAEGSARSRCACTRPSSLISAPWALPTASSNSRPPRPPPASPPSAEATPTPAQWPPRLFTPPPVHRHRPPGPPSPLHRRGRVPSLSPHPVPTLSRAQTPCRKPTEGSAPSATRGSRTWRAGRGGGAGRGRPSGPDCRRRPRRRGPRPARGSAESSPVASKSGCATVKSPTFLEPLERHLSGGGWGVFFQVSQQGALCGPSSPGPASRLSAPPPPNDQLPATLLPGAARGWLAAARKQQPGSLLHDNWWEGGREARREDGCGVRFLTMVIRHSGRARRQPPTRAARRGARTGKGARAGAGASPAAGRAGERRAEPSQARPDGSAAIRDCSRPARPHFSCANISLSQQDN